MTFAAMSNPRATRGNGSDAAGSATPPTLPPDDEYMTPRQAAAYIKFSERTLADWRLNRTGPIFSKVGDGVRAPIRYRRADLDAFLLRHQRETTDMTCAAH